MVKINGIRESSACSQFQRYRAELNANPDNVGLEILDSPFTITAGALSDYLRIEVENRDNNLEIGLDEKDLLKVLATTGLSLNKSDILLNLCPYDGEGGELG